MMKILLAVLVLIFSSHSVLFPFEFANNYCFIEDMYLESISYINFKIISDNPSIKGLLNLRISYKS